MRKPGSARKYIEPAKVAVTAMGASSPAGDGVPAFWSSIEAGRDLIREITAFNPAPYDCRKAALHPGPRTGPQAFMDAALDEALAGGGPPQGLLGLSLGTTLGGAVFLGGAAEGPAGPGSYLSRVPYHALTDHYADRLAVDLPPATLSGACASSLIAIGLGFLWVRSGRARAVVAGGYDFFSEFVHSGFSSLKALTAEAVRPFDRRRSGIALGEGAGVLLLEDLDSALESGRKPLALVSGFSSVSDANHITGPHPNGEGLFRTIVSAAAMAGAGPRDFDYVMAHGTATVYNDRMESIALTRFFGAAMPPASSIKSMVGHTLGAAGALESIAAVMAIREGAAPPTINFSEPDPECVPDPVPGKSRKMRIDRVLKTSSGFGGQNCAVVFERYRDA